MKKPKPTITPIIISDDNLEFLKKKLDDPNLSQYLKRRFIREIMGSTVSYVEKCLQRWQVMIWMVFHWLKDIVTNALKLKANKKF